MKNFLLKALYGALGTLLVTVGQALAGQTPDASALDVVTSVGLVGAATGAVAAGKRFIVPKKK